MSTMPPLLLLQTVEAVTRLGSFKEAADDLCVTPSAISHRVRSVEQTLGARLFDRVGQGVQPTPAAIRLSEAVGAARIEIGRVWREISEDLQDRPVTVRCMASFGEHFILPYMERFRREFRNFDLELTSNFYSDVQAIRPYDFVIGLGAFPGGKWQTEPLLSLDVHPILSPRAWDEAIDEGMLRGPLIGYGASQLSWEEIASTLGLRVHPSAKVITFDSIVSACVAAEHGLGIALAPSFIACRMEQQGKVKILGRDAPIATGLSYWLAVKPEQRDLPVYPRFRRWLLAQIAQDVKQQIAGAEAP